MNSRAFDSNACSDRVNSVIIGLNCNLGSLSGNSDNFFDSNQSVKNFRNLLLKKSLQKHGRRSGKYYTWSIVFHFNSGNYGPDRVSLAEEIRRNLLCFRQKKLIVILISYKNLFLPCLINLTNNNLSNLILIKIEQIGFINIHDSAGKILL